MQMLLGIIGALIVLVGMGALFLSFIAAVFNSIFN